jgi:hypothetical protein
LELAARDLALIHHGLQQHQLVFLALMQVAAAAVETYAVLQLQAAVMVQPTLLVQMELLTQAAEAAEAATAVLLMVTQAVQVS